MPTEGESQPERWSEVITAGNERSCADLGLVLTARGFTHRSRSSPAGWVLEVPEPHAAAAREELLAYRSENLGTAVVRPIETRGEGWPGAAAYAALLLASFILIRQSVFGLNWFAAGRLEAGSVVGGEWWRAVTALTVHVELDHLAGNLGFGLFFGYFVGRYFGTAFGWLAILTCGTVGNLANAFVQVPEHRSIGASTAVFAALGLMTAYTWQRGFWRSAPWRTRFAPITAGIGLLAFTGTGDVRTDLVAHLTGFAAGFGGGYVVARFELATRLRGRFSQTVAGAIAVATILSSWAVALVSGG